MIRNLFFLLLISSFSFGQSDGLQLLSKPKDGAVHLRWAPTNTTVWQQGNANGYTVEKRVVQKGEKKVNGKIQTQLIKPITQNEWVKLSETEDYAKIIKGYYYDEPIESADTAVINNALKGRFVFVMLAADMSSSVAKGLALSWKDENASQDEVAQYTVYLNDAAGKKTTTSAQMVDGLSMAPLVELPQNLLDADYRDSLVTLQWDIPNYTTYSAYNVERSDDGGKTFNVVNDAPIFPTGDGATFEKVLVGDKVPELFKTYWYRVRGIDPFADWSKPTPVTKVFAYQTTLPGVSNQNYFFPDEKRVALSWSYPDSLSVNLQGYNLYRTTNSGNEKISENPIPAFKKNTVDFLRPTDQNVIYNIAVVDLRGNETFSEPLLVIVEDTIAPLKATRLRGSIDKNGIATVKWDKSVDRDVFSYDIYKADSRDSTAMFPIYQSMRNDTVFVDTVGMKTTNKYVYYMVVPADFHTNICTLNDTLRLVRPDVLVPEPPIFSETGYNDSTIIVKWYYSPSEDVVVYNLFKQYPPDTTKLLLQSFMPADSVMSFYDKEWEEERANTYILEAIDGAELTSGDSCKITLTVPKPLRRPPVNELTATYEKRQKAVSVAWKYYAKKPLVKFDILRKEGENGKFKIISTAAGSERTYVDEDLKEDTVYFYRLFAHWADETVSSYGKIIDVKVK